MAQVGLELRSSEPKPGALVLYRVIGIPCRGQSLGGSISQDTSLLKNIQWIPIVEFTKPKVTYGCSRGYHCPNVAWSLIPTDLPVPRIHFFVWRFSLADAARTECQQCQRMNVPRPRDSFQPMTVGSRCWKLPTLSGMALWWESYGPVHSSPVGLTSRSPQV